MAMNADDGPITLGDPKGLAPSQPMNAGTAQRETKRKGGPGPTMKRQAGSKAVETGVKIAIAIALADGPLPVGDTIAAVGLVAIGAYLVLSD
jgi:hypothetical protein